MVLPILFALAACALGVIAAVLAIRGADEPRGWRIGAGALAVVCAAAVLAALDLAGVLDLAPNAVSLVAMWIACVALVLAAAASVLARRRATAIVVTVVSAVLAAAVALVGPVPRTFEGMVIDQGSGPAFCTVILESYPPQCGDPSPVRGWDWDAVEHERSQSIRWGEFRFTGVRDGGGIVLTGAPQPRH